MGQAMKRGGWLLLLLCLAIGCGGSKPGRSETPKSIVSVEGDYRIAFPKTPKRVVKQLPTDAGKLDHVMVSCETSDGTFYAISTTAYPEEMMRGRDVNDVLNGSVQGMQTSATWTNVVETPIRLASHYGRDVTANITSPQFAGVGKARSRLYFVGDRLYQILIISTSSKDNSGKIEAFVNSFELLKDVPDITAPPEDSKAEAPATR